MSGCVRKEGSNRRRPQLQQLVVGFFVVLIQPRVAVFLVLVASVTTVPTAVRGLAR